MLIRSITLLVFFISAATANAAVVYDQMAADLQTMEDAIQASIVRVETKEDKIIEKTQSENKGMDLLGYAVNGSPVRVTAFRLQGVLRLLTTSPALGSKNSKDVNTLYRQSKTIEDAIGKMDEKVTTLNNAIKKGASDKKIKGLRKAADEQSKLLNDLYKEIGWLKKDAANDAIKKINFLTKLSEKDEARLITSSIVKEISTFKNKIEHELSTGMRDQEFSHDSMEHNFHEFRREIRWVAIYFSSLPGLFSLSPYSTEGTTPEEREILETYKGNKYAEIDSENSPIVIDRLTFYTLAHYIQIAGDAKDQAEEHFKLLENGIDSDLDEAQFKIDMVNMMDAFIEAKVFNRLSDTIK